MKNIKDILIAIFFLPVWYMSSLFPKDKSLIIFGSWYGSNYKDNSKYLFEYFQKKKSINVYG